jgi:hypothetical protein
MNEHCGTGCRLMSELCAVRLALAPMVARAEVVSDTAYTLYNAARAVTAETATDLETASLEQGLATEDLTDAEWEEAHAKNWELLAQTNRALSNHARASQAREELFMDAADTDPARLRYTLSATSHIITELGHVCTKGPTAAGQCKAPRFYRQRAKKSLGWAKESLLDED